jgi:hypothetical protein
MGSGQGQRARTTLTVELEQCISPKGWGVGILASHPWRKKQERAKDGAP